MKKILTICVIILVVNANAFAGTNFKIMGSQMSVQQGYGSALSGGASLEFMTEKNYGVELSGVYMQADNIKFAPLSLYLKYVLTPQRKISMYVAGGLDYALLSDNFESPTTGYGAKLGFDMKIDRHSSLFVEAGQMYILDLNPTYVNVGISIHFYDPPKQTREQRIKEKKRKRREERRKRLGF